MKGVLYEKRIGKSFRRKEKLQQKYFKTSIDYIDQPTYEDNTINDLLYMKRLKAEIVELELILQLQSVYEK